MFAENNLNELCLVLNMAERLFDDSEYSFSYEIQDNVVIFDMEGWQGFPDEELEGATEAYRKVVSQEDVNANVTIVTDPKALPPEAQDYVAENWAKNLDYVDVDRCAFVSEGSIALTLKANIVNKIESDAEVKTFNDVEKAVEWAKNT